MLIRIILGIAFFAAGVLGLGDMWNLWNADWLWQQPWTAYIAPVALILIGNHLIFHHHKHEHERFLQRPVPSSDEGKRIVCRTRYGGDEYVYHGETFHGASLEVFCGGIRLDLRDALITEDEAIDIHANCSGVEIIVPSNVNVVVNSRSFCGGVENETRQCIGPEVKTLHVTASVFMGGISIKN